MLNTGVCDPSICNNLALRVDPTANNNKLILRACQLGDVELVRELLRDPRVNPADRNNACIEAACANGHVEIVEMLLQTYCVDATVNNHASLRSACLEGHAAVAKLLLDNYRGPTLALRQLLISVCRLGHVDVFRVILAHLNTRQELEEQHCKKD